MLKINERPNSKTFIADVDGIIKLKRSFVLSKPEFLYLRKGEDVGAEIISIIYGVATKIDWNTLFTGISAACAIYTVLQLRKDRNFRKKYLRGIRESDDYTIKDFRILCTKNNLTILAEKINRKIGVKVKFAPKRKAHKHRFYLTDKAYAFFVRVGEGKTVKFYGHLGTDKAMIQALKNQFLSEW